MLRLKKQSGFTLVEVVITLAIAGFLIPIIFTGQREVRDRQQFSDAVERVKNNVIGVKNEAFTTVNTRDNGEDEGRDPTTYVWGKYVLFFSEDDRIQVTTLIRFTNDATRIEEGESYEITVPHGVINDRSRQAGNPGQYIIFIRDPLNGQLKTYLPRSGQPTQFSPTYGGDSGTRTENFCFDNGGVEPDPVRQKFGCLEVNASQGSVRRNFFQ